MALQFTNLGSISVPTQDDDSKKQRTGLDNVGADLLAEVRQVREPEQDIELAPDDTEEVKVTSSDVLGGVDIPLTPMEERKARIEEAVGEEVHAAAASAQEIAAAIRDGVICKVHIKRERFQTKTTAAEMGVNPGVASKVLSGLGNKLLAPKDILGQMNSADTMARNLLARYGLKTPWGRFIPTKNWGVFKEAFECQKTCYYSALDTLLGMMEDGSHETWIIQQYTEFAYDRWKYVRESYKEDGNSHDLTLRDFSTMETPPPGFVSSVVDAALARIPDVAVVRESAAFCYELTIPYAPDTVLATQCATGDPELNAELYRHMDQQKRSLVDDFLRAAHEGLVEHINGLADSVGKTLANKSTVHGKTINRILSALAEMRTLNVTSNEDFETKIQELEGYIQGRREGASTGGSISSNDVLNRLRATASSITESLTRDLHGAAQFNNLGA